MCGYSGWDQGSIFSITANVNQMFLSYFKSDSTVAVAVAFSDIVLVFFSRLFFHQLQYMKIVVVMMIKMGIIPSRVEMSQPDDK